MTYIDKDTLLEVRGRLQRCLELMHKEANTSSKEELVEAIELLDAALESLDEGARVDQLMKLVGKAIEKLPWIVSILKELD